MERIVDDGSLDDHVDSFLTHDDADRQDPVGRDVTKGISISLRIVACDGPLLLSKYLS